MGKISLSMVSDHDKIAAVLHPHEWQQGEFELEYNGMFTFELLSPCSTWRASNALNSEPFPCWKQGLVLGARCFRLGTFSQGLGVTADPGLRLPVIQHHHCHTGSISSPLAAFEVAWSHSAELEVLRCRGHIERCTNDWNKSTVNTSSKCKLALAVVIE